MKTNAKKTWHDVPINSVFEEFDATSSGLDDQEVVKRLRSYGANRLPNPEKTNKFMQFLQQFHNALIYVLLFSAVIMAFLNHFMDSAIILAVVLANAIIGFFQEGKAEKAIEAIQKMLSPSASVLRNGTRVKVDAENLVPGDIVILEAGDKVPADLRLFQSHALEIQEAILTGESVPVEKKTEAVSTGSIQGDQACMAFSGTVVTAGQGRGVVVATGIEAEIGRITRLLSKVEKLTTPLVKQMDQFAKWLTLFILIIAGLILLFGYFVGKHDFSEVFMAVVGLSVAAIPEGLPAVLTITLAVGVQKMAQRHAIVRRLPAIETLGSVSVICTDKTGTLTRNEMMVVTIESSSHTYSIGGEGYKPSGKITCDGKPISKEDSPNLLEIALGSNLCNDSVLKESKGIWKIEGDPMEAALLSFSGKLGIFFEETKTHWTRTDIIPFEPEHRLMATLDHDHEHRAFIFCKGAPEQLLDLCIIQRSENGKTEPINKSYWVEKVELLAKRGQRVLALAVKSIEPEHTNLAYSDLEEKLIFLGLIGLIDPPRLDAIDAIKDCQDAGIRIKMITGDHAATASAIASQIGLINSKNVITGVELEKMGNMELEDALLDTDIFARTKPEHKLRIVKALQQQGMIVAMTGDGVNDAPALKRADIGIAMGKKGSDAAKEASEFVLADDSFTSIAAAVKEGRTVYDNIKKVISWTLPTNAGEAMTILLALLLGTALPVTPIQILWINLITAISLGIALAFESTEENTMRRPPRPKDAPILSSELIRHIILVSLLFLFGVYGVFQYAIDRGYPIHLARTIAFNTLVIIEVFHLFFIRNIYSRSISWNTIKATRGIWISVVSVIVAQLAATYLPFMHTLLGTESISFFDVVIIIFIGLAFFAAVETEKQLSLRISRRGIHTS